MKYRIGDKVYPYLYNDLEKIVESKHNVHDLVGIVTEVKYGDASITWLTANREQELEIGLRTAWWEEDDTTYDYYLYLEKIEDVRIDLEQYED